MFVSRIAAAKEYYFYGNEGKSDCPGGNKITDLATCKHACDDLKLPMMELENGNLCYKDFTGQCYQNGQNGGGASLVCKRGKISNRNCCLPLIYFYRVYLSNIS